MRIGVTLMIFLALLGSTVLTGCGKREAYEPPRLMPPQVGYAGLVREATFPPTIPEGSFFEVTLTVVVPDRPWLAGFLAPGQTVGVSVEPSTDSGHAFTLRVWGLRVDFGMDEGYTRLDVQQPPFVELTMHFPDPDAWKYIIGNEPLAAGVYKVMVYSGSPPAGSWVIDNEGTGGFVDWGSFEVVPVAFE